MIEGIPTPTAELGKELFQAGITCMNAIRFRDMGRKDDPDFAAYFNAELKALALYAMAPGTQTAVCRCGGTVAYYRAAEKNRCIRCGNFDPDKFYTRPYVRPY